MFGLQISQVSSTTAGQSKNKLANLWQIRGAAVRFAPHSLLKPFPDTAKKLLKTKHYSLEALHLDATLKDCVCLGKRVILRFIFKISMT
jgi:hypothetical protein